jgi:molybdenum cofactor sulfurtransferase
VQHPLEWIEQAHQHGWDVLLDAAAFVPTSQLDLKHHQTGFCPVSFYKMFGYPTGLGALIARKEALSKIASSLVRGRDDHRRICAGR